ncbi:secreted antigen 1 [Babesia divergens]|uniref:Secreted antigen 1 n=1 Tax=Babesia divergens TaxID=32595 RepID=A0AAD9LHV3_BABDI|nr:secreted antigen 1 [Babesia divergens]
MKLSGILRVLAPFFLAFAYQGQPVSCGKTDTPEKSSERSSTANTVEISEKIPVASYSDASVPVMEPGLVFEDSSWHDSQLASTVLFIKEFCKEINAKKFGIRIPDDKYEDLNKACGYVSSYLQFFIWPFVPKYYGPGIATEREEIPRTLYQGTLNPEKFEVYLKWLVKHIPEIRVSLKHMYNESIKLSEEQLMTETSVGPLKYGFVCVGNKWFDIVKYELQPATRRVSVSLQLLKSYLEEIPVDREFETIMREFEEERKAKQEGRLKRIAEQSRNLVKRLSKSDATFSLEDMTIFLGILGGNADVDPEAVQQIGKRIHAYLGSLGIHGHDAKSTLENLIEKIDEYVMDLSPSSGQLPNEEDASVKDFEAILKKLEQNSPAGKLAPPGEPSTEPAEATVKPHLESASSSKSCLVFHNSTWDDSQLASAVLFLEEFCKGVNAKKFNGKFSEAYYEDFSRACIYLSFKLESVTNHFTPTYGPGSASERKEIPEGMYENALRPEDFKLYVEWLNKNIPAIMDSMISMYYESTKLGERQLQTESSTGPLKYGFVYDGYWWGEIISWLPEDIYADPTFLEALKDFHNCLGKILKSPSEESTMDSQVYDGSSKEPDNANTPELPTNLDEFTVLSRVIEDDTEGPSSVNVPEISENPKESPVESQAVEKPSQEPSSSEPSAPVTESRLVFEQPTWDGSHFASAIFFLDEFCWDVEDDRFSTQISSDNFKQLFKACSKLSYYLVPFSRSLMRSNVHANPYKDVLKPEKFKDYAEWLVKNLPKIRQSYIKMHESVKLTRKYLKGSPLSRSVKYDYLIKDGLWRELMSRMISTRYTAPKISLYLKDLRKCLKDVLASSRK